MSARWSPWDDPLKLTRDEKRDYFSHIRAWRFDLQCQWLDDAAPLPAKDPGRMRFTMERNWRVGRIASAKRVARWKKPRWVA